LTPRFLHRGHLKPWSPKELKAHLAAIIDKLVDDLGPDDDLHVSPLSVALELLGGELEAFVLFGRTGHLDPPNPDGVPIAIVQCRSEDPKVDATIRGTVKKWISEQPPEN